MSIKESPLKLPEFKEWNFYKASQVIPLALNDPNVERPADFFTLTWGEEFIPLQLPVPYFEPEDDINYNDFRPYLNYTAKLQKKIFKNSNKNSVDCSKHKDKPTENGIRKKEINNDVIDGELERIPQVFLNPLFKLESLETFEEVMPWEVFENRATNRGWSLKKKQPKRGDSKQLLRAQMTHYLDIIETKLSQHLSRKSAAFFNIVESQENILRNIREISNGIRGIRGGLQKTTDTKLYNQLKLYLLRRKKARLQKLCTKLSLMKKVHETLSTIESQQVTEDHVATLDLIATTKDVLRSEIPGLTCFRFLTNALSDVGEVIENKLEGEFTKLFLESVSLYDMSIETVIVSQDFEAQVALLIARIVKQNRLQFLTPLKHAMPDLMRSKVQQSIEIALNARISIEESKLIDMIKELSYDYWIEFLSKMFNCLVKIIEKIAYIFKIINLSISSLNNFNKPEIRSNSEPVIDNVIRELSDLKIESRQEVEYIDSNCDFLQLDFMNDDQLDKRIQLIVANANESMLNSASYSSNQICNIEQSCDLDLYLNPAKTEMLFNESSKLLQSALDVVHAKCSKIVGLRAKSGQIEKLNSSDFLHLVRTLERFINRSQHLTQCYCPHLRSSILTQAKKFIEKFHDDKLKKLKILLEQEQWTTQEIPTPVQTKIKQLELGLLNHRNLANPNSEAFSSTSDLIINSRSFRVVSTLLMLISMLIDYCYCADDLPMLTTEILTKIVELLKFFNTRCWHLVLGAGALPAIGLKSITARHLGLVLTNLEVLLTLIPYIEEHFKTKLTLKQQSLLIQFERTKNDFQNHQEQLQIKINEIMEDTISKHMNMWDISQNSPSTAIKGVSRQICKLHEALNPVLSAKLLQNIFGNVLQIFSRCFSQRLTKLAKNRQSIEDAVIQGELSYLHEAVTGLEHLSNLDPKHLKVTF